MFKSLFLIPLIVSSVSFASPHCSWQIDNITNYSQQRIRQNVQKVVDQFSNINDITSTTGGCIIFSQKLFNLLIRDGVKNLTRIESHGFVTVSGLEFNSLHAFIVDSSGATPIIIDPTYLQFFRYGREMGLPRVFIGTQKELLELFTRFRKNITILTLEAQGSTTGPKEFVESTWPLVKPSRIRDYQVQHGPL